MSLLYQTAKWQAKHVFCCGSCREDKLLHVMVLLELGLVQRKLLLLMNSIDEGSQIRLFLEILWDQYLDCHLWCHVIAASVWNTAGPKSHLIFLVQGG